MKKINPKNKEKALSTLIKAFDIASSKIFDKELAIGKYLIKKQNELYFVYCGNDILYGDIYLVDVAILIAQNLDKDRYMKIINLVKKDNSYGKWHNDICNFKRMYKTSDEEHRNTIAARYIEAKFHLDNIKNEIKQISN